MPDSFHDSPYLSAFPGNDAPRDRILPSAIGGAPTAPEPSWCAAGDDVAAISGAIIHRRFGRSPARRSCVAKLATDPPPAAIAAQITARASGNCEIMAPACTYQQAVIFRRRRADTPSRFTSPADGIAACANCVDLIEHTDLATALDLGYLVDARTPTCAAAVLWRQHRWAYLDIRGRIHIECTLSHAAC